MKTKVLTEISVLMAVGFALKFLTDIVTRTALSFLLFDPLVLVTVLILMKHRNLKVAASLAVIQTVASFIFFPLTDMWFIRPVMVFTSYVVIAWASKRKWKVTTKFAFNCFFTSKFTILTVSLLMTGVVLVFPEWFPMDTVKSQMELLGSGLPSEQLQLILDNLTVVVIMGLLVVGVLYAYIPALAQMAIAFVVAKTMKIEKYIK